ncbi:MAG: GNAT family N-acetyltransferase [Clostridia bacterium]|nr:GNAT family N-acetyltransferase [Clostridia bacterium]
MINIKENIKNVKEFNLLYDAVGWGAYDERITKKALDNTFYSVSVYDDKKIVGYGRIIGDAICFLYIQDIMVKPEYQGNKIGTMIMKKILERTSEIKKENPDLRVYLGASKDREKFYEKFGFIKRTDANLGYGMILNK